MRSMWPTCPFTRRCPRLRSAGCRGRKTSTMSCRADSPVAVRPNPPRRRQKRGHRGRRDVERRGLQRGNVPILRSNVATRSASVGVLCGNVPVSSGNVGAVGHQGCRPEGQRWGSERDRSRKKHGPSARNPASARETPAGFPHRSTTLPSTAMPLEPAQPAASSSLSSQVMRDQLNALADRIVTLELALGGTARNPNLGTLNVALGRSADTRAVAVHPRTSSRRC